MIKLVLLLVFFGFGQSFNGQQLESSPIRQCIRVYGQRFKSRETRHLQIRTVPLGVSNLIPKACTDSKPINQVMDVGKCFNAIVLGYVDIENFYEASDRKDFSPEKIQKIYEMVRLASADFREKIDRKCGLQALATMNSICANQMRIAQARLVDYRPTFGEVGGITKDQIDTAVAALASDVGGLFSEKSANQFAEICSQRQV